VSKINILFRRWLVEAYGENYKYVVRNNLPILLEAFAAGYKKASFETAKEINALGDTTEEVPDAHEGDGREGQPL
jgi:hypothetical protein